MERFILSHEMEHCIKACYDCTDVCTRTAAHCLATGGAHAGRSHQTLLQDCADLCLLAARLMARASQRHACVCNTCAEVCRECAEACRRFGATDERMARCAEVCDRCAQTCQHTAAVAA